MFIDDDKEISDILLQSTQPSAILQASLHFLKSSSYTDFKFSALIFYAIIFLTLVDLPDGAEGFINVGVDADYIIIPHAQYALELGIP